MGNVNEKRRLLYEKLYLSKDSKAHQILLWYLQERFRDGTEDFTIISSYIFKSYKLIKNGRSIGTTGISKILKNIKPFVLTNKINPTMALLLSLICTMIEDLPENFKDFEACKKIQRVIEKTVEKIRFGKGLSSNLLKLLNAIQNQLALIGRRFEMNNQFVNVANLKLWCNWATLHYLAFIIAYYQEKEKISDWQTLLKVGQQYQQDFQQLLTVLARNAKFEFEFREENFLTYPMENEKRWWLEAKVKLTESEFMNSDSEFWESEEHSIGQICLTKGHPKSQEYVPGLIRDPEFLRIWSCVHQCGNCIKCSFVQNVLRELRNNFDDIFQTPLNELLDGCSRFKLLQM